MHPNTDSDVQSLARQSPVRLDALTSIRFFAAVHIFVFHIFAGHQMKSATPDSPGILFPVFDQLPSPILRFVERGPYSTPLFFVISGFILTYLYVRPTGSMSVTKREFWISRLTRIYPLHLVVLFLLAPIMLLIGAAIGLANIVLSGICSLFLIQAWIPPYALSWNVPTWALSAVVFFYVAFPWLVERTKGWSRKALMLTSAGAVSLALIPTLVYVAYRGGPEDHLTFNFWRELIMRNPLLWLAHFYAGIAAAKAWRISRFDLNWRDTTRRQIAIGDVAFVMLALLWTTNHPIPTLVLRHGLLVPLYVVMIVDLAQSRGVLYRVLAWKAWRPLGEASFSIFVLQLPAMIVTSIVFGGSGMPSWLVLILSVAGTVIVSVASTRYFEKPIASWLRTKWLAAKEPERERLPATENT